jgi:hypothetical protein
MPDATRPSAGGTDEKTRPKTSRFYRGRRLNGGITPRRSEDDLGALVYHGNLAGAQVAVQNTDGREYVGAVGCVKRRSGKGGGERERETEREREREGDCTKHYSPTGHDVSLTSQPVWHGPH